MCLRIGRTEENTKCVCVTVSFYFSSFLFFFCCHWSASLCSQIFFFLQWNLLNCLVRNIYNLTQWVYFHLYYLHSVFFSQYKCNYFQITERVWKKNAADDNIKAILGVKATKNVITSLLCAMPKGNDGHLLNVCARCCFSTHSIYTFLSWRHHLFDVASNGCGRFNIVCIDNSSKLQKEIVCGFGNIFFSIIPKRLLFHNTTKK